MRVCRHLGTPIALCGMILFLCLTALPLQAQEGYQVVEILVLGREQLQKVADLGVDIWRVEGNRVTASVGPLDRRALGEAGFSFEVVVEDVRVLLEHPTASYAPSDLAYHTVATLATDLYALETSGIAKVYDIGDSPEGRDIHAVRISDYPDVDEGEPAVLLVGCHHAREWISVEVPFYVAQHLVDRYPTDPQVQGLVDHGEIWIIPMLNPDGHQYSVETNRLWRKNRRDNGDGSFGVDLNRNYATGWGGPGSSGSGSSDAYAGPEPFSEPETKALRDFFLDPTHDFKAMISFHSFGQLILYPWGHMLERAPDHHKLDLIAGEMETRIEAIFGQDYTRGPTSTNLYMASGTAEDWTYDLKGIPSYNIELRSVFLLPGFLLPPAEILPTSQENIPAVLYMIGLTQNDQDGDGVVEIEDNCIGVPNPDQEDRDGDHAGAACDCDDSDPGLLGPDTTELCANGLDEDCDGLVDGDDPDCVPATEEWSVATPAQASVNARRVASTSSVVNVMSAFGVAGLLLVGWKLVAKQR